MSEHLSSCRISRRSLLRGGATAAAVAVVRLPLASCTTGPGDASATDSTATTPRQPGHRRGRASRTSTSAAITTGPISSPRWRPTPATRPSCSPPARPRPPRTPQFIATYFSVDAGATWARGALPQPPAGQAPASDDVTVAFDPQGRGYLCASRADDTPGGRAMYVWRTDDGGRSFSAPPALVPEGVQELDHQAIAAGAGQTPQERNVYVTWAGGADNLHRNDLGFTRSSDGGRSFEPPRTILTDHRRSETSAGRDLLPACTAWCAPSAPRRPIRTCPGTRSPRWWPCARPTPGKPSPPRSRSARGSPRISLPGGVIANGSDATVAAIPHGNAVYAGYTPCDERTRQCR
jgi:hypothetical protein